MPRTILVLPSEYDYPFVTGRSTPDSFLSGEKLVEVLESGLRRYGW